MRYLLEKLAGVVMAIVIVGIMLAGLVLSLESGKPAPNRNATASLPEPRPEEQESPATAMPFHTTDQLRAGCVDEVRRGTQSSQPSMCSQYADRSRGERPVERTQAPAPVTRPVPPAAEVQQPQRASREEMLLASAERHCRYLGYGTIKYRRCRADVSRDLSKQCVELKAQRERASSYDGDFERLVEQTQVTCYAADSYKIID